MSLNELADRIHAANKEKGFYKRAPYNNLKDDGLFLFRQTALIGTEVSEALEELRRDTAIEGVEKMVYWENEGKPRGFPTELADVLIRTLDVMAYCGIDIDKIIELKLSYNASRESKHGKAF